MAQRHCSTSPTTLQIQLFSRLLTLLPLCLSSAEGCLLSLPFSPIEYCWTFSSLTSILHWPSYCLSAPFADSSFSPLVSIPSGSAFDAGWLLFAHLLSNLIHPRTSAIFSAADSKSVSLAWLSLLSSRSGSAMALQPFHLDIPN